MTRFALDVWAALTTMWATGVGLLRSTPGISRRWLQDCMHPANLLDGLRVLLLSLFWIACGALAELGVYDLVKFLITYAAK